MLMLSPMHPCSAVRGKKGLTAAVRESFSQLDTSGMLRVWSQKSTRSGFEAKLNVLKGLCLFRAVESICLCS